MELRELLALVTVAELGSVTAAARALHLGQPAVSRQIRTLEEELGAPLFSRTAMGMELTVVGRVMYERSRRALDELDAGRAAVRRNPIRPTGVVAVGLLESMSELVAQPLAGVVRARYPKVELRIVINYSLRIVEWLSRGHLDVAVLEDSGAGGPSLPLAHEPLWAVAPPRAGLVADVPVPWRDLVEHPLVLPLPIQETRSIIDRAISAVDGDPQIILQTNEVDLQKRMVQDGLAWTVLPVSGVIREIATGTLSAAPLGEPDSARRLVLAFARAQPLPAAEAVGAELVRLLEGSVLRGEWPATWLATSATFDGSARQLPEHGRPHSPRT